MIQKDIKICGLTILSSVALLNTINVSAQKEVMDSTAEVTISTAQVTEIVEDTVNNDSNMYENEITTAELQEGSVEITPLENVVSEELVDLTQEGNEEKVNENEVSKMNETLLEPNVSASEESVTTLTETLSDSLNEEESTSVITSQPVIENNAVTNQHQWQGTFFGESTKESKNSVTVNEDGTVTLKAANYDPETKIIQDKGGKFTSFHDGISYYYTEIDAKSENFTFSATFNVDYLNPKADGQEGFGIIIRDQIGYPNTGDHQFPTNSVAAIAAKVKVTNEDSEQKTLKPGLSSRFVTGLTEEIIQEGATAMSENGKNEITPFKDDLSMKVEEGKKYTLTVKKTNTGYHTLYEVDGEVFEKILYGPEKLLQINPDKVYLGVAAARGVVTTVSDMILEITNPETDAPAEKEPVELVEPIFKLNNYHKTGNQQYNLELVTNVPGTAQVYDASNQLITEVTLEANYPSFVEVGLTEGDNHYTAKFEASNPELLTITDPLISETSIHHQTFEGYYKGNIGTYLRVSPQGTAEGDGTAENPLDIFTAIDYIQPGQMIELDGGVYEMSRDLIIHRGNNGTEALNKLMGTVSSAPAIFDFTNGGSFQLNGDYWKIDNIQVRNTQGNIKGLTVGGHHNHLQRIEAYNNGDTGIQISGNAAEHPDLWPTYNVIENSTSYNNVDPGHNNADGFAAKITVGEGNVFRGNIAYNNVDDGWDLFAKLESGLIGVVTIEDSIAYRNGTNLEKDATGDGNGFKLGGDGIAIGHILRNSLSFYNDADGVTSNSNPAANVFNVISVKNNGTNLSLYGKGNAEVTSQVEGIITWDSKEGDRPGNEKILNLLKNYINGQNIEGLKVDESWFENTDMTVLPTRNEDGSINLNGLFVLTNGHAVVNPISSQPLVPYFVLNEEPDEENHTETPIEEKNNDEIDETHENEELKEEEDSKVSNEKVDSAKVKPTETEVISVSKDVRIKLTKASQLPATGEKSTNPLWAVPLAVTGFILSLFKRRK